MSETVPEADGCPWPVDPACLVDEWESTFDEATKTRAIALASNTLRRLTGYRVGGCPVTIRPCSAVCTYGMHFGSWFTPGGFVPVNWSGTWTNCGCPTPCRHNPDVSVKLPPPVYGVSEVKVDGVVIDPTDYWLSGSYLVRTDGGSWPRTQNLDLPDTQAGTFSVTYLDSAPVDGGGAYAAGKLAMEYAKACSGKGKCALPAAVTQVVRQGVTYNLPSGSFPGGETGIREVDAYIALWNPDHRMRRSQVYVP